MSRLALKYTRLPYMIRKSLPTSPRGILVDWLECQLCHLFVVVDIPCFMCPLPLSAKLLWQHRLSYRCCRAIGIPTMLVRGRRMAFMRMAFGPQWPWWRPWVAHCHGCQGTQPQFQILSAMPHSPHRIDLMAATHTLSCMGYTWKFVRKRCNFRGLNTLQ